MRNRIVGLKTVRLSSLRGFAGGNPKQRHAVDRELLETSLDNHGYVLPIAVRAVGDGTYEVIDGHHRLEVLLDKEGPDVELKVLVIDCESVVEGRRLILALQHTAAFDTKALEKFVADALAEGADAAELMADTGMTGADLNAFATAASEFLDDSGDEETKKDDDRKVTRAGLTPELVQYQTALTRTQSSTVHEAIKLAKTITGVKVSGDALAEICGEYLANHKREAAPSKKGAKKGATRTKRR